MRAYLISRAARAGLLALGIVAIVGWLMASHVARAQFSDSLAWPNTDFERSSVDLDEIQSGGPPRDGIPPIDRPQFDTVADADQWLNAREPVIVVSVNGHTKAYPLQILTWHEIVNDSVGEVPVAVTFCPLCNASIVFDRRSEGRVLDFGTTGKLRKSDLVMYDRQTESWWQQFTGRAIVGEMTGTVLDRVPASIVAYESFREAYPDAPVLSRRTGHLRQYGTNPYRGYDTIEDQPFLFFDPVDKRLPPMERVLNITVGDRHAIYPWRLLKERPVINDEVNGLPVVVLSRRGTLSVLDQGLIAESRTVPSATAYARRLDGRTLVFEQRGERIADLQTGSTWNLFGAAVAGPLAGKQLDAVDSGVHFAFAWLAFNPESHIYDQGN